MILPSEENERRAERWSEEMAKTWSALECAWIGLVVVGVIALLVGRAIYLAAR